MLNVLVMTPAPKDSFGYIKYLLLWCASPNALLWNTVPLYKLIKISKLVKPVRFIMLSHYSRELQGLHMKCCLSVIR